MKKIFVLTILLGTAFVLSAQSLIGSKFKSKESIILYLIEQEKLAHDFYRTLDTLWVTDIFQRIATEEYTHMGKLNDVACELMITVPNHFNEYPTGQFSEPKLRRLYSELMMVANTSLEDAFRACANLEERKILDLKAALREPNFEMENLTYKALLIGCEDNLKLFIRAMLEINCTYQPILLGEVEYEALTKNILPNDGWRTLKKAARSAPAELGLF